MSLHDEISTRSAMAFEKGRKAKNVHQRSKVIGQHKLFQGKLARRSLSDTAPKTETSPIPQISPIPRLLHFLGFVGIFS